MKKLLFTAFALYSYIGYGQDADDIISENDRRLAASYDLRTPLDNRPEAKAWAKINRIEYRDKKRVADSIAVVRTEKRISEQNSANEAYEKQEIKQLTQQFGAATAKRLLNNEVWVGMTDKMVSARYGQPTNVSKTTTGHGIIETWYYQYGGQYVNPASPLLTFKNHKVVSFTE